MVQRPFGRDFSDCQSWQNNPWPKNPGIFVLFCWVRFDCLSWVRATDMALDHSSRPNLSKAVQPNPTKQAKIDIQMSAEL